MRLMLALAVASPMVAMGDATWTGCCVCSRRDQEHRSRRAIVASSRRPSLLSAVQRRRRLRRRQGRRARSRRCSPPGCSPTLRIDREGAAVVVTVSRKTRSSIRWLSRATARSTRTTLTGEVQLKPRSVFTRARAQADVQRILDVYRRQGLFAASRRAEDHRARAGSRQPRVRDQRRQSDQSQRHQLRRQPRLHRQPAARHHHHDAAGWFDFLKGTTSTIRTG